jgi:hypothetical protein
MRVLFTLPDDPDYGSLNLSNYTYKEIDVRINGVDYYYTVIPSAFSATTLSYQRRIVFDCKIAGVAKSSTYVISVRIMKNYGTGDDWSTWSSSVTINDITYTAFSPAQGAKILASDYNSISCALSNMRSSYNNSQSQATAVTVGMIIRISDFTKMYSDMSNIVSLINSYGSFDNVAVKMPTLASFPTSSDTIITYQGVASYFQELSNMLLLMLNS